MSIHEIPLVRIVLPFGLGIFIGDYMNFSALYCLLGFSLLTVILFLATKFSPYNLKKYYFIPASMIVLMFGGVCYVGVFNELNDPKQLPQYQAYNFSGIVSNLKSTQNGVTCDFQISKYFDENVEINYKFKTKLYTKNAQQELKNGDKLIVHGKLIPIKKNTNPHTFDYKNFLRHKYVYHQIHVGEDNFVTHEHASGFWSIPIRMNNYVQSVFRKYACCAETAGIAIGMITGNKSEIPDELMDTYSNVGTMHLLAVSGLHVGIISAALFWLLSQWRNHGSSLLSVTVIISAIWFFVIFTGAKPSTVRAGIMFTVFFVARLIKQLDNPYNIISFSALITLVINPHTIFDLGFKLSYLAVFSIFFFYPRINRLIDYRKLNKVGKYMWGLVCLSLSANILILPLSVYYFNQLPVSFLLSNMIAVPAAFVIVIGGFVIVVLESILPSVGALLAGLYFKLIWIMNTALKYIEEMPGSLIENISVDNMTLAFIYFGIASVMIMLVKNRIQLLKYPVLLFSFVLIFSSFKSSLYQDNHRFTVYDIYGKTVVDYMVDGKTYQFADKVLSDKVVEFNIEPNRTHHGNAQLIDLSGRVDYSDANIEKRSGLIAFGNELFFFPKSKEELQNIPAETDYLILNHTHGLKTLEVNKHTKVICINDKYLNNWSIDIPNKQLIKIGKEGAYSKIIKL